MSIAESTTQDVSESDPSWTSDAEKSVQRLLAQSNTSVLTLDASLVPSDKGHTNVPSNSWPVFQSVTLGSEAPVSRYALKDGIVLILHDRVARLFDSAGNRFFSLDESSSRMLLEALVHGTVNMIATLSAEYEVPPALIQRDWMNLLGQFRRGRLLSCLSQSAFLIPRHSVLDIWIRITVIRFLLISLGWHRTVALLRFLSDRKNGYLQPETMEHLDMLDKGVKSAASHHLWRIKCKERSLVTWYFLRRLGLRPQLQVGVSLYPFEAHAWVDCCGKVIGDSDERSQQFAKVLSYV